MAITFQSPSAGKTTNFDLSLKIFSGMILGEFNDSAVVMDKHRVLELEPGAESVQFPALGTVSTKYHAPGENIITDAGYLQTVNQGERLIYADRACTSSVFIDKLEERIAKPAWRAEYSRVMGEALALNADEMVLRTIIKAAKASAGDAYSGAKAGGGAPVNATATAAAILDELQDAQVAFDENNVPMTERYALLTPTDIGILMRDTEGRNYINHDFEASNGSLARGVVGMIAGFQVVKTTNIPTGAGPAAATTGLTASKSNDYSDNLTAKPVRMIFFQREAVGTARSAGVSTESEYKIELQGDLLVASYAMGHGVLRPECARIVTTA